MKKQAAPLVVEQPVNLMRGFELFGFGFFFY